jgi:hypothetical protein
MAWMIAVILAVVLAGCTIAYVNVPEPGKGRHPTKRDLPFPVIANNSTIRLEAADYIGDVSIRANKVTIIGRGIAVTRIRGNVTISGNNCAMHQLTIAGSVLISGNNADLRGTRIQGKVHSAGKNNRW